MYNMLQSGTLFKGSIGARLLSHFLEQGYTNQQAIRVILAYLFPGEDSPITSKEAIKRVGDKEGSMEFATRFVKLVVETLPDGRELLEDMVNSRSSVIEA